MRQIYSNAMLAHLWANGAVEFARNHNSSMMVRGPALWAGGAVAARHITHNGEHVVLLNRNRGSAHYAAAHALKNDVVRVLVVDPGDETPETHLRRLRDAMDRSILSTTVLRGGREKDAALREASAAAADYNEAARVFGVESRLYMPEDLAEAVAQAEAREAVRRAEQEEARRVEHEAALVRLRKVADEWLAGGPESGALQGAPGPALLRVKGGRVETSKGAHVPVPHAKRLWPLVLRMRRGEVVVLPPEGVRLGHFKLDRIMASGDIEVGCHRIEFSEMERIAKQLNLSFDPDAAAAAVDDGLGGLDAGPGLENDDE